MTKSELIDAIAQTVAIKKKDVVLVVNAAFATVTEALAKGEKCTFVDFGVFEVRDRAAREGRNPQDTAKIIKIPAKKVAVFRPGKGLKEKVLMIGMPGSKKKKKK